MENTLMKDLHLIRNKDEYLEKEIEKVCNDTFFPKSTLELTLDLSNVTSAFYGLALKNIIELVDANAANIISEKIFYDLGRIKTQQCKTKYQSLPDDTTAFAFVVISAIYNASPEYSFNIIKLSPKNTSIKLEGIDRYLRILTQLKIDQHIKFPTLIPFMKGIKDELQLDCEIDYEIEINKPENKTSTTYKFTI